MTTQADIEDLKCQLDDWRAAKTAAASGESYSIDGIAVTRQPVATLQANIDRLHREIIRSEAALLGADAPAFRVARMIDPWA